MKSNIFIFTQTLQKGGSEKQALILAKQLSQEYSVSIVIFYSTNKHYYEIPDNVSIVELKGCTLSKAIKYYKLLKKIKPLVVFNYLLLPTFLTGAFCFFSKTKSIGGMRSSKYSKHKFFLYKILHNYFNTLTVINNYRGYDYCIKNGFIQEKLMVIPNAINIIDKPILRNSTEKVIILSVGRFEEPKDYHTALMALRILRGKGYFFKYIIVGWGSLENEIRNLVDKYSLSSNVEIVINPNNIEEYYKIADIFLQTSIFEGLSNTVMEAINYSLPLVVTDVGDNFKLVIDEKNGFLCPVSNPKYISSKLEVLILNKELRNEFGEFGHKLLSQSYSTGIFKEKYLNIIDSLM